MSATGEMTERTASAAKMLRHSRPGKPGSAPSDRPSSVALDYDGGACRAVEHPAGSSKRRAGHDGSRPPKHGGREP